MTSFSAYRGRVTNFVSATEPNGDYLVTLWSPAVKYPYLLGDTKIDSPDQVWGTDITYVRLRQGFLYLVAIIDWFSRYVLSWRLSNSL